jgi:hypothetical protein
VATGRVTATRFLLLPSTPEDHTSGWADSAFRLMCNRRRDETLLLRNVQLARRKKLSRAVLLTAMLAMALAAVAPAFAQDSIVNQEANPTAKTVWPKKNGKAKANPTTRAAVLPETGGAPLFAVGAGMLLIGGGVLARRIVR